MLALTLALIAQDTSGLPDGSRLAEGATCYVMAVTRDGIATPLGRTYQRVEREVVEGREVLRVIVHQEIQNGAVSLRDSFVLDGKTMRPIAFANERNGEKHIDLAYGTDQITGTRHGGDDTPEPINVQQPAPVWEGNLYGLTFAALPLAAGARFTIPFWQYDKGFGEFFVTVTESRTVETVSGPVDAWVLEAGDDRRRPLTYLIAKDDHRELGYSSGPISQTIGGDCTGLGEN